MWKHLDFEKIALTLLNYHLIISDFVIDSFFYLFGKFDLVYRIEDGKADNVTFFYYLDFPMGSGTFRPEVFRLSRYQKHAVNHYLFVGDINDSLLERDDVKKKRKNIELLSFKEPVDFDLN